MAFHFQLFGLWLSSASGNCFAPALQFNRGVTIRTRNWLETRFYCRYDRSFDWNSEHIAYYLGKHHPGDEEKGYPALYEYRGILGFHQYV